jgi:hypothetical protein
MKIEYPIAMYLKDIRKEKRVCKQCGDKLIGPGHFMYTAVERGKYLCHKCERPEPGREEM